MRKDYMNARDYVAMQEYTRFDHNRPQAPAPSLKVGRRVRFNPFSALANLLQRKKEAPVVTIELSPDAR